MAKLELENYMNGKLQSVRLDIERNKQKLNELTIQLQKLQKASTIEPQLQGIQSLKKTCSRKRNRYIKKFLCSRSWRKSH